MKKIIIFKKLITIYYYLLALGVFVRIIETISHSFNNSNLKSKLFGLEVDFSSFGSYKTLGLLMMPLVLGFIFFKAIHILKCRLDDLEEGIFFTKGLVLDFKKTGILFVICSLGELIGSLISRLIVNSEFYLKLDKSIVLFFIMGLFFMFLSEVFEKARVLKEENELTV